uniref:Probable ATP-dependent RNA helicase spindle-E n=1 Tax=Lygus hesperus TaxID=30085 RepID=A0A0A9XRC0_LYGHE
MSYDMLLNMARGKVPLHKIQVNGGLTEGRLVIAGRPEKKNATVDRARKGSGYAREYQLQEEEEDEIEELPARGPMRRGKAMAAVEDLTSHGTFSEHPGVVPDDLLRVYDDYPFDHTPDKRLLINEYKDTILSQIEANPVVIVKGATGCGKSTQVPQFILDDARSSQIYCNIVITQPRRIAAKSVAARVCEERGWNVGTLVGYQIGLEKKASDDTRLLYCTAGVLLQQLIGHQSLSMYTHIIIDEVHERENETDFLLIVIKKLMRIKGNRTKLILMSATMNTGKFVDYFSKRVDNLPVEPPVIELQTEPRHLVQEYFLDSLGSIMLINDVAIDEPKITTSLYQLVKLLIQVFPTLDIQESKSKKPFMGSVLIFLPGINEIDAMYNVLRSSSQKRPSANTTAKQSEPWLLCTLHSTVSFDEQMKVFMPPPTGSRKIILATNVAESSITVPDVRYVIDFCLTKHQVQDKDTFYSSLQLTWVSKRQAKQRAGRVGRTMPGRVYRLIPEAMYEELEEDSPPEILRCPLDQLVLKAKKLDIGSPKSILGSAIDPPDLTNIQRTILNLKEVGALTLTSNGEYDEDDGDMTFIGTVMESLPLDVQLSKLILAGHMLSVLRECVIMACCMTGKSILVSPIDKKIEAFNTRVAWADGGASDPLTYLSVYTTWKNRAARGGFAKSGSEELYAKQSFLNLKSLKEVERLENEVMARLERMGIRDTKIPMVEEKVELRPILYKIAIAGAFYPNYFTHSPIDEKEAVKVLGGRDPCKTVYLTKFPRTQPGPLYRDSIKKLFENCGSNIKVQFDGSAKVYVEFGNSRGLNTDVLFPEDILGEEAVPGRVMKAVYRAVKLRQLNIPMIIPMLSDQEADRRARAIFGDALSTNIHCWQNNRIRHVKKRTQMPGLSRSHIRILILHIVDPSNFYVLLNDGPHEDKKSMWIHTEINNRTEDNVLIDLDENAIQPELLCVAPFSSGPHEARRNYRAKVLQIKNNIQARVFFIDYGNVEDIEKSLIKGYGPALIEKGVRDEPPLCINCRLAEVQPVAYKQGKSGWSIEAIRTFETQFLNRHAQAKIYSTVNDTLAVYLFSDVDSKFTSRYKLSNDSSFNHALVRQNYGQFMEEPYLSKENHALREKVMESPDMGHSYSSADEHQDYLEGFEFSSPTEKEARFPTPLHGPRSPLEMTISSITRKCIGKTAAIEFNSVNSVLLDNNPMDTSSRLVVAGTVTQNFQGDRLTLRNTTIMPSIRGIVGIMCLVFTPKAELRVDPTRSYVTGALCGLGCDEEGMSYDQENDIEVAFDCKFDMADIETINKIRFWMNEIMCGAATSVEQQMTSRAAAHDAQTKIIRYLLALFQKTRDPLCPTTYDNSYEWNQISEDYLLKPTRSDTGAFVYPLIWGVELREPSREALVESLRNTSRSSICTLVGQIP